MQPFGRNRYGPKIGGSVPFGEGERGPHLTHKVAWAEAYLHTKWHLDPCSHLATTNMGRKLGAVPLWGGELVPCLTQCVRGRPTYMPSFILMHPTVWPQCTNVTDRQTGQSDSIGRTVLQTVAHKRFALCYRTVVYPIQGGPKSGHPIYFCYNFVKPILDRFAIFFHCCKQQ